MIIKWFDNASFLLKAKDKNLYIDPYSGEYLDKADIILVTHSHNDHCDLDKIEMLLKDGTIICTNESCAHSLSVWKNQLQVPGEIVSVSPGDRKNLQGFSITVVESYNIKRSRMPMVPRHPKGTQVGFIIEADEKRVYHAGDTDFLPFMKNMEKIDVALLPIMGQAMMDIDEAQEATFAIKPKIVIPIHRRGASAKEFKQKVEAKSSIKVLAISPGDSIDP